MIKSKVKYKSTLTYKLKSVPSKIKKYISLNKKGKMTVNKNAPAGTYKIRIKITAKETQNVKKASKVFTFKLIIK